MSETPFAIGDELQYLNGYGNFRVLNAWYEEFEAFKEPQQVLLITDDVQSRTMRAAHLQRIVRDAP